LLKPGSVRRAIGIAGIVLLGIALALAPILAFQGGMTYVSAIGIAGIACLIAYRLLPRPKVEPDEEKTSG
jgi:multisubunit Na+/H+ antiporter MnhB subunit